VPSEFPKTYRNDLFMRAARGERTARTPVWLMRQAGRTDPAYEALKEEVRMPLHDMFRHPEVAARASLLPRRLGIDAIIFFQDILTPLDPMGAKFLFLPGPVLEQPVRSAEQVRSLRLYDVAEGVPYVPETFRLLHEALNGDLPVLGFAGAPLTLATFLIQGKSFGHEAPETLEFLRAQPRVLHELLDKLTTMTVDYLKLQAAAGAVAVQLFESAAYLFDEDAYREFALPYQQRIFEALRGVVPTIVFARELDNLALLEASGADILSLPSSVSIADARRSVGENRVVQGNLSNRLLAQGSLEEIAEAARACVLSGQSRGHIFNLDHGLLRETPYENILRLVEVVHNTQVPD
jgi:uroporphyrinogen decarboxylase